MINIKQCITYFGIALKWNIVSYKTIILGS